MALILTIDSSTETASVALALNGQVLSIVVNSNQKEHAAWLHAAIGQIVKDCGRSLSQLEAIAVTEGPGSYTGLRVGMATAKGLCYALGIPLIVETSLKIMCQAALRTIALLHVPLPDFFCPMIDARRMEVFTGVYGNDLTEIHAPTALVLDEHSYSKTMSQGKACFLGNGSHKWKALCSDPGVMFININFNAGDLIEFAEKKFSIGAFADLAYVEPLYVKEFYTSAENSSASSFNKL